MRLTNQSFSMLYQIWPILLAILLLLATFLYLKGWRRLRVAFPQLATRGRLAAFLLAVLLLGLVFVAPLMQLSQRFLAARALQKVLLCMLAPAMLWISCPIHTLGWSLPTRYRRKLTRLLFVPSAGLRSTLRPFTQPGLVWLFFVMTFTVWHEPRYLSWSMKTSAAHFFSAFWLFGAAMLYWSHILYTGLRTHRRLSGWFVFAYLLGVEVPNMFVGVSMAFSSSPLYGYYEEAQRLVVPTGGVQADSVLLQDQMLSGGLIWVIGSLVYISAIVLVFNRLFKLEKELPPMLSADRDADERWIAPGLEYRVVQNRWRELRSEDPEQN